MKAHAVQADWQAVSAYLDALETDLATVDTVVKGGSPMADAILNNKISLTCRYIPVQADAISELDLCIIQRNLFDTAIVASLPLPETERLTRVYIDMKGPQLYISLTNFTAAKKQQKVGGLFLTT